MLDRIGHYRITGKLGEGGMGVVYAAEDERLGRPVAIKMIRREILDDSQVQRRLWREARSAAGVSHPNICQIYEIGEQDGELFLVMERLEGESLASRLERGPLPVAEAIQLCLSILSALEALHRRGLVHRDLKPSNVFLCPHGIKLLDFGLARPVDPKPATLDSQTRTDLTAPGLLVGTPQYMAPEQLEGKPPSPATDLFAAGSILFEMLTGKPAFGGKTAIDVLHAIRNERPPALGGSPLVVEVDRLIRRALAKRPEERYSSALEMAEALRPVLSHQDTASVPRVCAMTRLIVLPFRILRPDPETDFLAFSLADAITSSLSGLSALVVRSSLAASCFASERADLRTIAAEAEVDVVLTGTLLRAGDRIRVNTQLVEAPGGTLVCSHSAEILLRDVFQLQDEMVDRIVNSLSLPLSAREHGMLKHDVPASPTAYEFYLRGNQHLSRHSTVVARDLYLRCVEESPRYAPAWARLGRCYRLLSKWTGEKEQNLARAEESFQRALELNPDLPMAHNFYAHLEADLGRARDAMIRLLARARVSSSDPELFAGLVHVCRYCGLLDASLAAYEQVRRLDPNLPTSVAHTYFMKGDYSQGLKTMSGDIGYVEPLLLLMEGREREALALVKEREQASEDQSPVFAVYLASLRTLLEGKREESIAIADRILALGFDDPEGLFYLARQLAYLGEHERALAWFRRSVEQGYYAFEAMVRDPWLDPLRTWPEFNALLRDAESSYRSAAAVFLEAGGDRVLGISGR